MTFEEVLFKFEKFVGNGEDKKSKYPPVKPIGLLSPSFPYEFNVSAGHDYAMKIFGNKVPIIHPIKYSLIDTCFRRIDVKNVGFSGRHLSLFHVALFAYGATNEKVSLKIDELVSDFIQLLSNLNIPLDKLLITVFGGGQILNLKLGEESALIEALQKAGISKSNILPLKGRRSFFRAQNVECAGPTCEIFFDRGEECDIGSRFVEIGSINFYKYRNINKDSHLEISTNQVFVCALGIERALMILQNKPSIFDIDVVFPLMKVVDKHFSDSRESSMFINSVRTIVDGIRSLFFILAEGITPDNSPRGRIVKKIIKNVVKQMKYLNLTNPNLLDDLLYEFQEKIIELYTPLHPDIKQKKIDLHSSVITKITE